MITGKKRKARRTGRGAARRGAQFADFIFGFSEATVRHVSALVWLSVRSAGKGVWAVAMGLFHVGRVIRKGKHTHLSTGEHKESKTSSGCPLFIPVSGSPTTTFDQIVGHDLAKQELALRLVWPILEPERARRFGIRSGGGLLLYGPPGTGKTMLARATASQIDASFFHVRPSDIMASSVGAAESNIERLFTAVGQFERSILFIDEIESITPCRRRNGSTIAKRVVSEVLSLLDGFEIRPPGLMFIAATNELSMVDPAMLRPGRFDMKVYCGPPERAERARILQLNLVERPLEDDIDFDLFALETDGWTGADLCELANKAADAAFMESVKAGSNCRIGMRHIHDALELVRACSMAGHDVRPDAQGVIADTFSKARDLDIASRV